MKVLILLSFINLPWIVNKRKNAWNSLLSVGDSRYIIDGNKKRIGSSYVIDKDQEKKRKKKGRKRNYTLKRLKYSLIYALKNFNRFSKLMNLNTHIYKHEIKHETSKSSYQRRSIGIYRFFFSAICTLFEWKKRRMIEINKLATGLSQLRFHNNDWNIWTKRKRARDVIMLSKISWPSITHLWRKMTSWIFLLISV